MSESQDFRISVILPRYPTNNQVIHISEGKDFRQREQHVQRA